MNSVIAALARNQSTLFKTSYTPKYVSLVPKFIVEDRNHPLHETQKRKFAQKKQEGLWWHATTGADLSKSSCVRSWARRRLREAVVDELKARGYDEHGIHKVENNGKKRRLNLQGSLRLHIQAPLVPAKFVEVRAEASKIIDIMVKAASADGTKYNQAKSDAAHARRLKEFQSMPKRKPGSSATAPNPKLRSS